MQRKPGMMPSSSITNSLPVYPGTKNKSAFGTEDEESTEPGMYFQPYRPPENKDMQQLLASASPSQLSAFGTNMTSLYGGQLSGANGSTGQAGAAPQQRNPLASSIIQRNQTPTGQNTAQLPLTIQQPGAPTAQSQSSPSRANYFQMGQRGVLGLNHLSVSQQQQALGKVPNRTSISHAAFSTSQPGITSQSAESLSSGLVSVVTNAMNNISNLPGYGRPMSGENQPSLDLSEFPTLSNRSAPVHGSASMAARNYVGMVKTQSQEVTQEFQMQQDDFPALPGAQNVLENNGTIERRTPTNILGANSYDQALLKEGSKFPGEKLGLGGSRRGIQTHPDGTVSNIPKDMVTDQFGMVGLLTFIRAAENDSNRVALAMGIDLTTLGLHLNSPESLYHTFQSPWAETPCRPQDIDINVPSEYLTNNLIRDKLAPIKLNRFGDDLLFYLFYMNCGDVLQMAAAAELYQRNWRYHKEERVWLTRMESMGQQVTPSFERGTYLYFDVPTWRKTTKDFHIEYHKLEDRPQVLTPQQQQQLPGHAAQTPMPQQVLAAPH